MKKFYAMYNQYGVGFGFGQTWKAGDCMHSPARKRWTGGWTNTPSMRNLVMWWPGRSPRAKSSVPWAGNTTTILLVSPGTMTERSQL